MHIWHTALLRYICPIVMAKKRGQLSFNFDDERIPKLFGMLCLFLSLYLTVAFISYLFTWKHDQDIVYRFSWEIFFSDIEVENWLGRLGAYLSDAFIYWGFGISSFGIVYLLYRYGLALMRGIPISTLGSVFRSVVVWMVTISVISAFFLQTSRFPWGGEFGKAVGIWIQHFVGVVGAVVLLVFAFLTVFVWNNNPNMTELSWRNAGQALQQAWQDLLAGNYAKKRRVVAPANPRVKSNAADVEMPGATPSASAGDLAHDPLDALEQELAQEAAAHRFPAIAPPQETPLPEGQLQFDLSQRSALFATPSKPVGGAELEINTPPPAQPTQPEEAEQYKPPTEVVQESNPNLTEPYDPTLELSHYEYPHLQLLNEYDNTTLEIDREELEANKNQILQTLMYFKIEIEKIKATIGPTVTLYEIVPAPGVRISKIKNLEDDIALNLSALGIRIIAPIPGKGTIGIEVPNKKRLTVAMRETLQDDRFRRAKMDLPIALGKSIQNEVFVADLAKMPHLLIAGATGQGKSVGINVILMSLLYKKHPSQVKIVMIDPKKVELFPYARLENHFLGFLPDQTEPIVTDTTKVVHVLNSLIIEMEERYDLLKRAETRNITEYNDKFVARRLNPNKGHKFMPFIVLVIDEFADLIMTAGKEVELPIGRLAQLARAVGIHLIIATQRPSVNIITGVIKANFPARIAYKVASKVDSRTILDAGGAEQLTGRGDMLLSVGGDIIRLQSAFVDTPEVEKVIDYIAHQQGFAEPFFLPEFHADGDQGGQAKHFSLSELDDLLDDAARLVVETQHGSTSMIQRRMKLGYNRAGRIMDQLESLGIVGPAEGSKPREVLYFDVMELERYLTELRNRK
jgi:DNA segregation ATPase FtsK/SpoIIIE, S-DNA-T family